MTHRVPGLPDSTPACSATAAAAPRGDHALLFAIDFRLVDEFGVGIPSCVFRRVPLPDLVQNDKALAGQLQLVKRSITP
jgi:hypothetical protein